MFTVALVPETVKLPSTIKSLLTVRFTAVAVPVNAGLARGALRSSAVCVAVETGFAASEVLFTSASPTCAFVTPLTVPVNVGDAIGALRSSAACVAVEICLFASDVSSTLVRPTIAFVIPDTVPVNVGEAIVALRLI